jgi:hypothetical protein
VIWANLITALQSSQIECLFEIYLDFESDVFNSSLFETTSLAALQGKATTQSSTSFRARRSTSFLILANASPDVAFFAASPGQLSNQATWIGNRVAKRLMRGDSLATLQGANGSLPPHCRRS